MSDNQNIREMVLEDVDMVSSLYCEMYREQKTMGMVMTFNEAAIHDMLAIQLRSRLFKCMVLEHENEVKGFAIGSIIKTQKKYQIEGQDFIGFINDVYVAEELRTLGLGNDLVEALEQKLMNAGIKYIELTVLEGNNNGKKFWGKKGYKDVIRVMYKQL